MKTKTKKPQGSRLGASDNALLVRPFKNTRSERAMQVDVLPARTIGRVPSSSLQEFPLRSFKVEHGLFCRMVIAPKDHCQLNPKRLHALRINAAWRAVRAAIKQYGSDETFVIARRMAGTWERARSLPNRPTEFNFDEADAVCMVLDAQAWMADAARGTN